MKSSSCLHLALASFWVPEYLPRSAWQVHAPFAFWLAQATAPRRLVELGPEPGLSFFAFCQAFDHLRLPTTVTAVVVQVAEQASPREVESASRAVAGPLERYRDRASVIYARNFEAALAYDDGSVDLLHIAGLPPGENTRQAFETWRPKLSDNAVVLFHDLHGHTSGSEAAALFEELSSRHPSFRFDQGQGLGLVCPNGSVPHGLRSLLSADEAEIAETRQVYAALGEAIEVRWRYLALKDGLETVVRPDAVLPSDSPSDLVHHADAPVLARLSARLEFARTDASEVDAPSPSGSGKHSATPALSARPDVGSVEPMLALLRLSLDARTRELERLKQSLSGTDPRSSLLMAAYAAQRQRLERQQAAIVARQDELIRWGQGRKVRLDALMAQLNSEIEARSQVESRLRDYESSKLLRAARRISRWVGARPDTARLDDRAQARIEQQIRNSGLFDETFYRESNPDLGSLDPMAHFARTGWWEGRRPNATFDPLYYLAANADVRSQSLNPLIHYADQGIVEGRPPHHIPAERRWYAAPDQTLSLEERACILAVDETGLFDEVFYRNRYPDVGEAGLEPLVHYALEGWREGRWPNAGFDPHFYRQTYADVDRSGLDPLVHYATAGLLEGRLPRPEAALTPVAGDEDGRQIAALHATGLFDPDFYATSYPDVVDSGQDPALHFMTRGWREGRRPNPYFDPAFYLEHNADVVALGLNPLLHYAESGIREGRLPAASVLASRAAEVSDYDRWVASHDTLSEADRRAMRARLGRLAYQPLISIILPVYDTPIAYLRETIASVRRQIYGNWELCIADDASPNPAVLEILRDCAREDSRIKLVERPTNGHISAASNSAIALAEGEFLALLDHDDVLPDHALFEVVHCLNLWPDVDLIYSDEDHLDRNGKRTSPYFKPDYNPDLMLGHNMVSHLGVYRTALVRQLGGFRLGYEGSQDYDLALRIIDATDPSRIRHIPAILYHWRSTEGEATFSQSFQDRCIAAARQALADHLQRRGEIGDVVAHPLVATWHRVSRAVPDPAPLVSIIVPTKDKAEILGPCCAGILGRTDYPSIELIIVDHQSTEPATLALLAELAEDERVRVMPYVGAFNYAAINNAAVRQARGSVLAFLNNDVDVIASDWLSEMVALACLPDVGAVGAKLLYPDRRVQHAGVVLGAGGVAGHAFHLLGADDPGDMGRAAMTMTVSAVTGACLVVEKQLFEQVGGFDADSLAVAFNDIDLCIKIREAGVRNVVTPHALLYHHESLSRGTDLAPEKRARFEAECEFMIDTWGDLLNTDPYYNPNLSLTTATYSLAWPPRRRKPWLAIPAA